MSLDNMNILSFGNIGELSSTWVKDKVIMNINWILSIRNDNQKSILINKELFHGLKYDVLVVKLSALLQLNISLYKSP